MNKGAGKLHRSVRP